MTLQDFNEITRFYWDFKETTMRFPDCNETPELDFQISM